MGRVARRTTAARRVDSTGERIPWYAHGRLRGPRSERERVARIGAAQDVLHARLHRAHYLRMGEDVETLVAHRLEYPLRDIRGGEPAALDGFLQSGFAREI